MFLWHKFSSHLSVLPDVLSDFIIVSCFVWSVQFRHSRLAVWAARVRVGQKSNDRYQGSSNWASWYPITCNWVEADAAWIADVHMIDLSNHREHGWLGRVFFWNFDSQLEYPTFVRRSKGALDHCLPIVVVIVAYGIGWAKGRRIAHH